MKTFSKLESLLYDSNVLKVILSNELPITLMLAPLMLCISLVFIVKNYCERSELSGLFNGTDFLSLSLYIYICICVFQAVHCAINVLNVSACI